MTKPSKSLQTNVHPPSLRIFFATELWERYGFYVIQTLLALYLALQHQWPDTQIYALVGSFTALTYLSPVIGGWIADQFLGQKRSVLTGAVVLFFSYVGLTIIQNANLLPYALAGVAVGTGLLKPNISSLLGNQYPANSSKKEAGFTIFYMGLTTGIILGTTLPSPLSHYFGWSASFASAALGAVICFLTFLIGINTIHIEDYKPFEYQLNKIIKAGLLIVALWTLCAIILLMPRFADISFLMVVLISVGYLAYSIKRETPIQAKKTMVIGFLCIISVMFWAFYFQMFLSLTLFIARVAQPTFLGIHFPPPYYVAVQSVGMLLFGYFLSQRHTKPDLAERSLQTNNKFLLAMVLMCFAYILITLLAILNPGETLLSPLYLIPAYLFISLAELLLSPVGLAAITTLAARHNVSTMMGIFFVSLGIGGFLSGKLANLTAINDTNLAIVPLKLEYTDGFSKLSLILILATALSVLLNRVIKKLLLSVASA